MHKNHKEVMIWGTIWSQAGKLSEFSFLFLLSIVLARGLGPESYGIYISTLAFLTFFTMVASVGLHQTLSNFVSKYKASDSENLGAILRGAVLIRVVFLGGLLLMVVILAQPFSKIYFGNQKFAAYFLVASFYIFFKDISSLISFYYIGSLQTKYVTIVENSALIASILSALVLLNYGFGITSVFTCFGTIYLVSLLIYAWNVRHILFQTIKARLNKKIWFFSLTVWVNNFLGYILGKQSDIFLLQWFKVGFKSIGYYNIAFSLVTLASTLLMAGLSTVSLPILSGINTRGDKHNLSKGWRLLVSFGNALSIPILVFLLIYAKPIISILYSEKYSEASLLLQIFAVFALLGRILGGGMNTAVLYATNKEKITMYVTMITGSGNVILNLIFIPLCGAIGAIIGTGLSNLSSIIILFFVVFKNIKPEFPYLLTLKIFFASGLSVGITGFITVNTFWKLMLTGCVYAFFYIGILALLKPLQKDDVQTFAAVPLIHKHMSYFSK